MRITHWHLLPYLIFGNMWDLIYAIKIQVDQPGLRLVCSDNILLLCLTDENRGCIDTSLCKSDNVTQGNINTDPFKSLRDYLCNDHFNNCSVTNDGNYMCQLEEHQNSTAILKVKDCWKENIKETKLTSEFIYSIIVFLSIITMFLSYLCLQKTLKQSATRKQNICLHVKSNEPVKVELV